MNTQVIQLFEGMSDATLTAYIQDLFVDDKLFGKRPAVIICPGGAYLGITEKEAEPVALKFLAAGYHAFVLRYSIGAEMGRFPAPFVDAAKSVLLVRENAERWSVDTDKICLCGFSTGGHIVATLGSTWHEEYLAKILNADSQLFKPNALILGYPLLDLGDFKTRNLKKNPQMKPLLDMIFTTAYGTLNPDRFLLNEWNCINRITSNMPPTFLWMTSQDALVSVEKCLDFIKALALNNTPYEFHIFENGAHGLSLGDKTVGYSEADIKNNVNVHKWLDLVLSWLISR